MAEQELELLIKLRDEATAHLESINKALGTNTEKWKDTYKATSDASNAGEQMLSGMTGKIRVLGISIGQLATSWVGLGAAIVAVGAAAITNAINIAKTIEEMRNLSIETGFSVQALSQWKYIAELSGKSLSDISLAMRTLSRATMDAKNPASDAAKAFRDLGLGWSQLRDLSPEDLFTIVGKAISEIENPLRRADIAMQLFGARMGSELLPIFDDLARKQQIISERAPDWGTYEEEAKRVSEALIKLAMAWDSLRIAFAVVTFPALTTLIDLLTKIMNLGLLVGGILGALVGLLVGGIPGMIIGGIAGAGIGGLLGAGIYALPEFQQGGIVPGPIGQPVPIIAHGGEQYLGAGQGMGGNITVSVNVAGSIRSDQDIASVIRREVLLAKQRNYNAGLA